MMRSRLIAVMIAVAAVAGAAPAAAGHHHHVSVGVHMGWGGWYGPGWGGWYGPGWGGWYGPGWYAPAGYAAAPLDVGVVDTDISPEHARVFLNGDLIGTADDFDGYPSYLFLKPGKYTLEFKLPGYATESLSLDVAEGRFFPLDMKLSRIPTEKPTRWYDLPEVKAVGNVFGPAEPPRAAPATGPDPSLRPDLQLDRDGGAGPAVRAGAALDLRILPAVASVYLDGEFIGTGRELSRLQRGFSVTPGSHRLEVMAPGHDPRTVTVDVPEGERSQVVVELDPRTGQS